MVVVWLRPLKPYNSERSERKGGLQGTGPENTILYNRGVLSSVDSLDGTVLGPSSSPKDVKFWDVSIFPSPCAVNIAQSHLNKAGALMRQDAAPSTEGGRPPPAWPTLQKPGCPAANPRVTTKATKQRQRRKSNVNSLAVLCPRSPQALL